MVGKQEHEFVPLTRGTIRLDSRFRGNDGPMGQLVTFPLK